jgi:hypothetical protein
MLLSGLLCFIPVTVLLFCCCFVVVVDLTLKANSDNF